jgi:autotransporter-associated beta strand protein
MNLLLRNGALTVLGGPDADSVQSLAGLTLGESGAVNLVPGAGRSVQLQAGTMAASGSGGIVRGANLGATPGPGVANLFVTFPPSLTNGIVARMIGDDSVAGSGRSFVTYSTSTGLRPLSDSEYVDLPTGAGSGTENVSIAAPRSISTLTSINSLRITPGGSLSLAGNAVLSVTTGALLSTSASSTVSGGTISIGNWMKVHTLGDLSITSAIAGNGASLQKSGPGTATMRLDAFTSSAVNVAGGRLRPIAGSNVNLRFLDVENDALGGGAATFAVNGSSVYAQLHGTGVVDVSGGTFLAESGSVFDGSFTGSGTLILQRVNLYGHSSAFAGNVRVTDMATLETSDAIGQSGSLTLDTGTIALGSYDVTLSRNINVTTNTTTSGPALLASGVGTFTGSISVPRRLSLRAPAQEDVGVYAGVISGAGSLDIIGSGGAIIRGNNTFTGGTSIRSTSVALGSDSALGSGPMTIQFGRLRAEGAPRTLPNALTVDDVIEFGGTRDITFTGPILLRTSNVEVRTDGTGTTAWRGPLSGSSGTSTLTKTGGGQLALSGSNGFAGNIAVTQGVLSFESSTTTPLSSLSLSNGAIVTVAGPAFVRTNALSLDNQSVLDLTSGSGIVDYSGASPMQALSQRVGSAFAGGTWRGVGITSSTAAASAARNVGVGIVEASDYLATGTSMFAGQPVDTTAVLLKYTYYGDTDFNGRVNFDDYVRTDSGFNNHLSGWLNGDFDLNGQVNFDDYVLIDLAFNTQSGTLGRALAFLDGSDRTASGMSDAALRRVEQHFAEFGSDYASHFLAAVPEPTSLALASVAIALLSRRRRRP